jgi:hypothetical protein
MPRVFAKGCIYRAKQSRVIHLKIAGGGAPMRSRRPTPRAE